MADVNITIQTDAAVTTEATETEALVEAVEEIPEVIEAAVEAVEEDDVQWLEDRLDAQDGALANLETILNQLLPKLTELLETVLRLEALSAENLIVETPIPESTLPESAAVETPEINPDAADLQAAETPIENKPHKLRVL